MSVRGVWPQAGASSTLPEYGVAYTVDWHKQRAGAKIQQGEAARQAQQAADAAITAAAARASAAVAAAGSSPAATASGRGSSGSSSGFVDREARAAGMAVLMRSLRAHDREKSGRVQVGACESEGAAGKGLPAEQQAAALALY
jgi:hypothetical protein